MIMIRYGQLDCNPGLCVQSEKNTSYTWTSPSPCQSQINWILFTVSCRLGCQLPHKVKILQKRNTRKPWHIHYLRLDCQLEYLSTLRKNEVKFTHKFGMAYVMDIIDLIAAFARVISHGKNVRKEKRLLDAYVSCYLQILKIYCRWKLMDDARTWWGIPCQGRHC